MNNMTIPLLTVPPQERTNYIIDQLEGERISIPGSKGVFRILASSKQTNGGIAVFQSGAVLSDAPGFHWHDEAHDVFLVTKGYLKLYNGDRCRIMGPGDFAYVPPVSLSLSEFQMKLGQCHLITLVFRCE
jgi:mannose-6-phosphate isomerase-like protein (cupin superfamily)